LYTICARKDNKLLKAKEGKDILKKIFGSAGKTADICCVVKEPKSKPHEEQ
jgi:hypothetical protein